MNLKGRIEMSNYERTKQYRISRRRILMKKILYKKMCAFIRFFLFTPYSRSFIFTYLNYTFWKILSSRIFFLSFVSKLGNPRVIFLYAFIKKLQFFKSNKAFIQSLINFWFNSVKLNYITFNLFPKWSTNIYSINLKIYEFL